MASTTSGQRRRTSTSVRPPAGSTFGAGRRRGRRLRCGPRLGLRLRLVRRDRGRRGIGVGRGGLGALHVRRRRRRGLGLVDRLHGVLDGRGRRVLADGRRARGTAHDRGALLQPVDPREQAGLAGVGTGQQHPGAHQLQQQPGRGGPAHLGEPGGHQVGGPAQLGRSEAGGLGDQPVTLVLGDVDQAGGRGVGDGRDDDEVAEPAEEVLGEAARVLPGLDDPVDHAEHGGPVAGRERVDGVVEERGRGVAEQARGEVVGDAVGAGAPEQLVEDRHRVTRGPGAGADDQRQRGRLDPDALALADLGEVGGEQPGRDQPEGVVVRTRADGRDDLLRLGGGEDEAEVRRGLLHQLEQGVEALRRDHVGLVDDVDLVGAADRCEERLLAEVAGVVDTTVGRRVDLDHVERPGTATGQVAAAVALPAGVGHRGLLAVERAGQDPGAGRLATAARTGEEVGVVDPVVRQRGPQRGRHVVLPDHVGERLGPVAAIEGERGLHDCTLTSPPDSR